MKRDELRKILPHREPMLLVDEAEAGAEGNAAGCYTVRGDEFFLDGHFPGNPVVPGVILCEMMAQTCCVLFAGQEGVRTYYTGIDKARFRATVKPGDTVEFKCCVTRVKKPFYFAQGEGFVDGRLCVKAEFSFALMGGE